MIAYVFAVVLAFVAGCVFEGVRRGGTVDAHTRCALLEAELDRYEAQL